MAEVTLTKLNKYFDTTHVVKDVDLHPTLPRSRQMPDIALRLDGISRHYGKVRAVDNLSIDIPSGAFARVSEKAMLSNTVICG